MSTSVKETQYIAIHNIGCVIMEGNYMSLVLGRSEVRGQRSQQHTCVLSSVIVPISSD